MKITWKATNYGQSGFQIEQLGEYDAQPPVDSLLVDRTPRTLNPERQAIAAYLAFGAWVSGDLELPQRLGPSTARAIERDRSNLQIRPKPIEYYPKPLEIGQRRARLLFDDADYDGDEPFICVLRGSEWAGSIRGLQSMTVSSNAFALDSAASDGYPSIRARLAVAVLFAGELSVDSIVLRADTPVPEHELRSLRDLLLAARLGLEVGAD